MSEEVQMLALCRAKTGLEAETRSVLEAFVKTTRKEPGCISYTLQVDADRPTDFWFIERWANQAAIDAHLANEATASLVADLAELLAEPATLISLKNLT